MDSSWSTFGESCGLESSPVMRAANIAVVVGFAALVARTTFSPSRALGSEARPPAAVKFETVMLTNGPAPTTLKLAYCPGVVSRHSVILMLGSLESARLPAWSTNLVNEGFMLAAFSVAYPPDPDPARRPQWLFFDQRFAHSYALGGARAPADAARVIDYLTTRADVNPEKIGWLGSSSTGIPGLAVATREPRLAAIVAFVSTGAYRHWLATWHTNGLWQGRTKELWPETEQLLREHDPILRADKLFPCAALLVSGGEDKVVDPATARAFVEAARPRYTNDPDRLRLVVYEGFGHNLPLDVVQMHAEHWFR
ncbi:MAG: prolyl oligopeptidase family serine peptidase, partial [Verrucomicrobia bacterium]|nr:prolyl oligopeptidase family serine peptidase [Verrucomicrobiota bacterium]